MSNPQSNARTLSELAQVVAGQVRGDASRTISGVNGLKEARAGELSFFNNSKYRDALAGTQASAILVDEASVELLGARDAIVVADPYLAFARVSAVFHPRPSFAPGIHPAAIVEQGAEVHPSATVMAHAFVSAGARVGARAVLFPGVFIGAESVLGEDALLYPNVVVRERCVVGARAIIHPGVVIGADGFGFAFDLANSQHFKIPQAGTVEIEPDVEIGANSAVDRGTLGPTRIGRGTKIDNLVQVGHNADVGPLCILCGQVGIAGSSKLGTGVVLGGQAGVANHLHVAAGSRFAAQSGVMGNIDETGTYGGSPCVPHRDWLKGQVGSRKAADTARDVAKLKRQVEELEAKLKQLLER